MFLTLAAGLHYCGLDLPGICWIFWPHRPLHALHWTSHHCSHYRSYWSVAVWFSWEQRWKPLGHLFNVILWTILYFYARKKTPNSVYVFEEICVSKSGSFSNSTRLKNVNALSLMIILMQRKTVTVFCSESVFSIFCLNFRLIFLLSASDRTTALIILFSQYLRHIAMPFPTYSKDKKLHTSRVCIFQILPVCNWRSDLCFINIVNCDSFVVVARFDSQVLLGITVSWLICYILTTYNVLPAEPGQYGYLARTDLKGEVISQAPWFTFPYPGKMLQYQTLRLYRILSESEYISKSWKMEMCLFKARGDLCDCKNKLRPWHHFTFFSHNNATIILCNLCKN